MAGPILLYDGRFFERWFVRYVSNGATRLSHLVGRGVFIGNNFAVRARDFQAVGGFDTSLHSAEDIDLGARLSAVTRTAYNPRMVMYISSRRGRERYASLFRRTSLDYIRVVILGLPPTGQDYAPMR